MTSRFGHPFYVYLILILILSTSTIQASVDTPSFKNMPNVMAHICGAKYTIHTKGFYLEYNLKYYAVKMLYTNEISMDWTNSVATFKPLRCVLTEAPLPDEVMVPINLIINIEVN